MTVISYCAGPSAKWKCEVPSSKIITISNITIVEHYEGYCSCNGHVFIKPAMTTPVLTQSSCKCFNYANKHTEICNVSGSLTKPEGKQNSFNPDCKFYPHILLIKVGHDHWDQLLLLVLDIVFTCILKPNLVRLYRYTHGKPNFSFGLKINNNSDWYSIKALLN